jgi:hypothetical protein
MVLLSVSWFGPPGHHGRVRSLSHQRRCRDSTPPRPAIRELWTTDRKWTDVRRGPLVAFLVANVVSVCGTRVSAIAIPWFVLMTTGSPFKTGVVALAEMAPLVLSKAIGGPLIDRIGGRRMSVTADAKALRSPASAWHRHCLPQERSTSSRPCHRC